MGRSHPGDGIAEIDHGLTSTPRRCAEGKSFCRVRVDEVDKACRLPRVSRRLAVRPNLPCCPISVAEFLAIGQRFAALPHPVFPWLAFCPSHPRRRGAEGDE